MPVWPSRSTSLPLAFLVEPETSITSMMSKSIGRSPNATAVPRIGAWWTWFFTTSPARGASTRIFTGSGAARLGARHRAERASAANATAARRRLGAARRIRGLGARTVGGLASGAGSAAGAGGALLSPSGSRGASRLGFFSSGSADGIRAKRSIFASCAAIDPTASTATRPTAARLSGEQCAITSPLPA